MTKWLRENNDLIQAWLWVALAIPTLLWWKESVLWVAIMSIYANAKTAHGAWKSDRAKRAAETDG